MPATNRTKKFLDDLEAIAGPDVVLAVLNACGGQHIYIPKGHVNGPESALTRALGGAVEANAIIENLERRGGWGVTIAIPLGRNSVMARSKYAIKAGLLEGKSVGAVALHVGVSSRTVLKYRSELVGAGLLTRRGA